MDWLVSLLVAVVCGFAGGGIVIAATSRRVTLAVTGAILAARHWLHRGRPFRPWCTRCAGQKFVQGFREGMTK